MNQYNTNQTPVYREDGRRVVGYIIGDTFYKTVSGSKHFLRQPPAIMFDVQSLESAQRYGAKNVQVKDRETERIYAATIALIWEKPIYKNYGFGAQVGLCLKDWTVNGNIPQMPKLKTPPSPNPHGPQQMGLFQA
ncbi:MAG: hypothetical protein H8D34_25410 [Chloroflexi bacterium]|nr:hypothetical protein [Chloroflexota bacterium]